MRFFIIYIIFGHGVKYRAGCLVIPAFSNHNLTYKAMYKFFHPVLLLVMVAPATPCVMAQARAGSALVVSL